MTGSNDSAGRTPSIEAYPDGPLIVRGRVEIIDADGLVIEPQRRTVALCRCGASLIKPWCDGTHKLSGSGRNRPTATEVLQRRKGPRLSEENGGLYGAAMCQLCTARAKRTEPSCSI